MDTERDFLFYNPRIATKYNPLYEGEYLVIQTYPREQKLIVDHRSFDYENANSHCESEDDDFDFDFDDQVSRPIACMGCANYHGVDYGNNVQSAVYTRMDGIARIAQIIIHNIAPDLGLM